MELHLITEHALLICQDKYNHIKLIVVNWIYRPNPVILLGTPAHQKAGAVVVEKWRKDWRKYVL